MVSTIEGTLRHAVFLAKHLNGCDLRCATTAILLELGIPVKRAAFGYLENAILFSVENPMRSLTKDIYPMVGELYDPPANKFQVERAIRLAINDAWCNRCDEMWAYYFHPDKYGDIPKPSNGEFIFGIVIFLRMWQGCCKGVGRHDA